MMHAVRRTILLLNTKDIFLSPVLNMRRSYSSALCLIWLVVAAFQGVTRTSAFLASKKQKTYVPRIRHEKLRCSEGGAGQGAKRVKVSKKVIKATAMTNSALQKSRSKSIVKPKKKKQAYAPQMPEFSRVMNLASVPEKRPLLCRLLANAKECELLAMRFDLPEITYFTGNVTITRLSDQVTVLVEGEFEAHIGAGSDLLPPQEIKGNFDTTLLSNAESNPSG